ncbi:unnamed protein product [Thelazia callipaeda]|uniref:mannose-6-phosphate isomerase n=1 Tax=Thelazia callipaeda TaxID=103827 RepID=A0A0N5D474_THECL|nr:unnamed protein product [Thelazia callipaeda]
MERLICSVQTYAWGSRGSKSVVANLKHSADQEFVIDEAKPYAELWMGVHANGPSKIASNGKLLSEVISKSQSLLADHENGTLQFLFKILSVNQALSIQSHPDKNKAKILHERDPTHYPDANHKPELAIALSSFQLLSGFRQSHEIYDNIKSFPELESLINSKSAIEILKSGNIDEKRVALKKIFSEYIRSSNENVLKAVEQLYERLKKINLLLSIAENNRCTLEELLVRLNSEYPGDVGIFAPLFLNYFTLERGEAVFMGPNSPHAYLFGDCVECMGCSDNTVRAGLTPKFKDVDTLCSDLTFEMIEPPHFFPKTIATGIREYAPPVSEFAVHEIGSSANELSNVGASSIIITVKGSTEMHTDAKKFNAKRGEVYFIPVNVPHVLIKPSADFLAYRAFTPKR